MRVQRLVMPGTGVQSWTVLGEDLRPVAPAERFLAYLASIDRSPNTVRAYAHDLKDWFVFLAGRDVDWRAATLEDVGAFAGWLRLSPAGRDGRVAVLPSAPQRCGGSSVNRKLAALTSFCEFHARHGEPLAGLLVTTAPPGRARTSTSSFKPFLHHISKSGPQRRRTVTVPAVTPTPRVLTVEQVQAILDACQHLRDRLLFGLLLDCGLRVGEALGLRHEDLMIAERQVLVVPRRNDNGARAKSGRRRTIPTNADVMRLYADYLNTEYGALDSDYVTLLCPVKLQFWWIRGLLRLVGAGGRAGGQRRV